MSYNTIGNKAWTAAEHLRQHRRLKDKERAMAKKKTTVEDVPTKTVAERIAAGDYKNSKTFVSILKDKVAWGLYMDEEASTVARFRADLAAEHGVTGSPKEPALWKLAWDKGHASGLSEVEMEYADFVELIK